MLWSFQVDSKETQSYIHVAILPRIPFPIRLPHSTKPSSLWKHLFYIKYLFITSLVAQLVKNLPAKRETWVRSLGWEDPLEKIHSSILAWRIPWTVARQAPLSMEFSRQEYWSGVHALLQGIFPTQGSNPGLPLCRQILYCLSNQGSWWKHITQCHFKFLCR